MGVEFFTNGNVEAKRALEAQFEMNSAPCMMQKRSLELLMPFLRTTKTVFVTI